MENISLVSWTDGAVMDETLAQERTRAVDETNVHEMAHSYFGDAVVIRDFAHAWLRESWATYIEQCWYEDNRAADERQYQKSTVPAFALSFDLGWVIDGALQTQRFIWMRRSTPSSFPWSRIRAGATSNRARPAAVSALADLARFQDKGTQERVAVRLIDLLHDPPVPTCAAPRWAAFRR